MPSSCDICWHQKCFSRSTEAMVLIITLKSEPHWVVNEKYTDSDLCKASLQMTVLTNSSHRAGKTGNRGNAPCWRGQSKRALSELWGCSVGWTLTGSERPPRSPTRICLRNYSCTRRKPQASALPTDTGRVRTCLKTSAKPHEEEFL